MFYAIFYLRNNVYKRANLQNKGLIIYEFVPPMFEQIWIICLLSDRLCYINLGYVTLYLNLTLATWPEKIDVKRWSIRIRFDGFSRLK